MAGGGHQPAALARPAPGRHGGLLVLAHALAAAQGQRADAGSRLEYVISTRGGHTAKQYEKVESSDYFKQHGDVLKLDYMYYLKLLSNPMDQVLSVAYYKKTKETSFLENFVLDQYKYRLKLRTKLVNEFENLVTPCLEFSE